MRTAVVTGIGSGVGSGGGSGIGGAIANRLRNDGYRGATGYSTGQILEANGGRNT